MSCADLLQEVLGQQRNVGGPLAQRRQLDVDHVDAVEEVLTETAFGDRFAQVFVGGQDHARVDREGLRAADLLELQILQHPQQLDLHAGRGGGDLVERRLCRRRPA